MTTINVYINNLQSKFIYYDEDEEIELNYVDGNIECMYLEKQDGVCYYVFYFINLNNAKVYLLHLDISKEFTLKFVNYILQLVYFYKNVSDLYIHIHNNNFIFKYSTNYDLIIKAYFNDNNDFIENLIGHSINFYITTFNIIQEKLLRFSFLKQIEQIYMLNSSSIVPTINKIPSLKSTQYNLKYNFKDIDCIVNINIDQYKKFLNDYPELKIGKYAVNKAGYNLILTKFTKLPIWQ